MNKNNRYKGIFAVVGQSFFRIPLLVTLFLLIEKSVYAHTPIFDVIATLNGIQAILMHVGPVLSAVLFVVAGIFYAIGQLFPSYKRANLHSASIDLIIGAIIVAVLSAASTGLAVASTHLLSNLSNAT